MHFWIRLVVLLALWGNAPLLSANSFGDQGFWRNCSDFLRPHAAAKSAAHSLLHREPHQPLTPRDLSDWKRLLLAQLRLMEPLYVTSINGRLQHATVIELDYQRMSELLEGLESSPPRFFLERKDYDVFDRDGPEIPGQFVFPGTDLSSRFKLHLEEAFKQYQNEEDQSSPHAPEKNLPSSDSDTVDLGPHEIQLKLRAARDLDHIRASVEGLKLIQPENGIRKKVLIANSLIQSFGQRGNALNAEDLSILAAKDPQVFAELQKTFRELAAHAYTAERFFQHTRPTLAQESEAPSLNAVDLFIRLKRLEGELNSLKLGGSWTLSQ